MRIAVTGASGYVGRAIAHELSRSGHEVIALSRQPIGGFPSHPYELAERPRPDLLSAADAVVHCAYDLAATRSQAIEATNVEGTRRLLASAVASNARFYLVSSMSAYTGTRQLYGRAKLQSERDVVAAGGYAVRLGLVYGGEEGGMVRSLKRIAGLPVVPIIGARSHQFLVHVDDMAHAVRRLIETPEVTSQVVGLAYPEPMRFDRLVRALAPSKNVPKLVPVPWTPVYLTMRLAEAVGIKLPLRADSILGLVRPGPSVPNFEFWAQLDVDIRAPAIGSGASFGAPD